MSRRVTVRTEELAGSALGWAIASLECAAPKQNAGQMHFAFCAPPVDEVQCERLIAKYAVWVERGCHWNWVADARRDPFERVSGETLAIAVCRAVLVREIGKTCSVPTELI